MLERVDEGVWAAHAPHRFFGVHIGARMTVVRLRGGELWVHSPVALEPELRAAIDALGDVAHIVCPNLYHHVYARPWAEAYPRAIVHAPRGLSTKRPDLRVDRPLDDAAWGDELVPVPIEGSMLRETVFVHPRTRTVVSADLTENFDTSPHWPTRLYLQVNGIHGRVGWSRMLRFVYTDRPAARRSVQALLEHDFDRVIVAHGRVLETGGPAALRQTFAFLG